MGAGTTPNLTPEQHLQCGKSLFNYTWTFLDKAVRTPDDEDMMVHASHASAYHWRQVGEAKHFVRSDWQLARVYAVCGRAEPALHHARRCLSRCQAEGIAGFDLGFAHEAIARAAGGAGDAELARQHLSAALRIVETVDDEEDRALLLADLEALREALR